MELDWIYALIGGGLIGLSATIHLLVSGRVTGVSGIYHGIFTSQGVQRLWRLKFVLGLLLGAGMGLGFVDAPFVNESGRSIYVIALAGLLVGFGTKLGSGCTSGHGVCGISRLSLRSIAATLTFMAAGIVSVAIASYLLGGQP